METAPIAVVTGAGRRLGYCICQALLERGYRIVALYRSRTDDLAKLEQQGATLLPVDLAQPARVQEAVNFLQTDVGPINLLVNNASEFYPDRDDTGDLAEQSARLFQINSTAPMILMEGLKAALAKAAIATGKPSSVINITDIFAERPDPRFAAYCASKAALANLTLSYAARLAPDVRVNAIMPGPIKFMTDHTNSQKAHVLSETLLAREGGFQSIVIQLLALLDNDFITGAQIPVDGGRRLAQSMAMNVDRNVE